MIGIFSECSSLISFPDWSKKSEIKIIDFEKIL